MKTGIIKSNKRKIKDLSMSIGAIAIFNMVIQFAMYPFLERNLGPEGYGVALSVLSVISILSGTLGTSASYSRMVTCADTSIDYTNGDYNIIILVLSALCGIGGVFYLSYIGISSMLSAIIFFVLIIITSFRYYSDVEYKMNTAFFRYMLFYSIISIGYIIGLFVYRITGEWLLAFLIGESLGIAFVTIWGTIYRKNLLTPSKNFSLICKSMAFLLLSTLIENLTLNADRLLLMVFSGGETVTIYYTASLLGKVVAMLSTPINSIIISYLVKYKGELTKKFWTVSTLAIAALGVLSFTGCTIVSPFMLKILYPDIVEDCIPYIAPSILGQIFYFISGILLVILLKFRGEKKQFIFNAAYAVEFFVIVILGTLLYGLDGFVYSSLIANFIRFIAVIIWGFTLTKAKKKST